MTLAAIREQLINRLADVSGAVEKYPSLPDSPPARLPAVVVTWSTKPVRTRYGNAPTGARHREHTFTGIVLLNQRGVLSVEDAAGIAMTEKILDSFEDNGRLDETASRCEITNVEPFVLDYGAPAGVAYYALRCLFTVIETTT